MKQKHTNLHQENPPAPLTLEQALQLQHGQTLYQLDAFNSDGSYRRWRVSGKVRTWKRDKNRVEIPIKHGLYSNDTLTPAWFSRVSLTDKGV